MVYYLHMKTLITLFIAATLFACASPEPSKDETLARLVEIRATPCQELKLKHLEYEALQYVDRLASSSRHIAYAELNRRCK